MRLRRAPKGESLSDKAHNLISTTESISSTLAGQGVNTTEANSIIANAKKFERIGDYSSAIERAEAAKLALIRAKREREVGATPAPAVKQTAAESEPMEEEQVEEDVVDLSKLPKNYMQAKFMLSSAKDLLDRKGITGGEAYDFYTEAKERFDAEDYSKALTLAIKAERLLDSDTVDLIGEEEAEEKAPSDEGDEEEVIEVMVCPECDAEVSGDDAFCRSCGEKLEFDTSCPGCDADIESDDKFCRKCGHKLD